jgi:hypothetical protein
MSSVCDHPHVDEGNSCSFEFYLSPSKQHCAVALSRLDVKNVTNSSTLLQLVDDLGRVLSPRKLRNTSSLPGTQVDLPLVHD